VRGFSLWNKICEMSGQFSGWLVVLMVCATLLGALSRYVLKAQFSGDEFSTILLAVFCYTGLAYAWKAGGQIRITFIVDAMPAKLTKVLRLVTLIASLLISPIISWSIYGKLMNSWQLGIKSVDLGIRVAIPQAFMLLGSILLFVELVIQVYKALRSILSMKHG
jgi:TRAP-type C4-dicarboxylate transport system permease small subunit